MKIIVKNLKGSQFEINVEPSHTVSEVKKQIEEEQKIEASLQKLVATGKVMVDDKTVEEYKLKDGDFIVVMVAKPKKEKEKKPEPASTPASVQPSAPTGMGGAAHSQPAQTHHSAATGPAPVPGQPSQQDNSSNDSGILRGEALENTLKDMQEMGFPRDECMRALRAAYYNADRAVDYLLNGIPEDADQHQPGAAHTGAGHAPGAGMGSGGGAGAGAGAGAGGDNPLGFLANNPMFTQLRQRLISDPGFFQTFMNQLAQSQPQLHQAISANPQQFLALLLGSGGEGGMGGGENDPPGTIRVTPEEKDAIERLAGLGFPKHRAIEAFFACDKNEEMAANYLFDNVNADDAYEENLAQEESIADAEGAFEQDQPGGDAQMHHDQPPSNAPASNDNMQVDNPPAQDPPAQNPPAQNPPANNPPGENPAGGNPPADSQDQNKNNEGGNNDEDDSCL